MKQGTNPSGGRSSELSPATGFTIVETLIVLAVTALLLVSSLTLVSGRQDKIRFQLGVNRLQGELQQVINETQKGYYPNYNKVDCYYDGVAGSIKFATGTGPDLGSNSTCMFIGKVIQFENITPPTPMTYDVHPVVALRKDPTTNVLNTSLLTAKPAVAAGLNQLTKLPDITIKVDTADLPHYAVKASDFATDTLPVKGFGFFAGDVSGSLAGTSSSGSVVSGAQQFSLYALSDHAAASIPWGPVTIDEFTPADSARHVDWITVCVTGGYSDVKSALITISDTGGLDVSTKFKSSVDCT